MSTILHISAESNAGGLESMLTQTAADMQNHKHEWLVVGEKGPAVEKARKAGVAVTVLGLSLPYIDFGSELEVIRHIESASPDLLKGWSHFGGNLTAKAGDKLGIPVIWRIGDARTFDTIHYQEHADAIKENAEHLSHIPRSIICISEAAKAAYIQNGYDDARMIVIPNGIDTERFRFVADGRERIRREAGITPDTFVVGMAARYTALKRFEDTITAVSLLTDAGHNVHAIMCGQRVDRMNEELTAAIEATGKPDMFTLLGERSDITDIYSAFDVLSHPSVMEGQQSNVVLEAASCGTPSVMVQEIAERDGTIAQLGGAMIARDPASLADSLVQIIGRSSKERDLSALSLRTHIQRHYNANDTLSAYASVYDAALQ